MSRDKYHPTPTKRSVKIIQEATVQGLTEGVTVLESVLEWRLVNVIDLEASESAKGSIVSQGTAEWTINRRSVPAGIYQVTFTVSLTIDDSPLPRNLKAFDYGFIEIITAPIRVIIDGGSSVRWGSNETITVNGSLSYDSNIGPGNQTGLNFTWSCRDSKRNDSMTHGCFHVFLAEGNVTSSAKVQTSHLEIGKSYVLRLTVSKGDRSSFAEIAFEVVDGNIPHVNLRCFVDCGPTIPSSNKLRVTSECLNAACIGAVYEWHLKTLNETTKTWQNISILPIMTSTEVNAANVVFNKNSFASNSKFSLMLFVTPQEGKRSFAVLNFDTNREPNGGYCLPSVTEGVSLETEFSFKCFAWQDENTPLTYEFRLEDEPISYGISSKSVSTVLPAGSPEDDYQLQINIIIKNAVGVAVKETLFVKVKPSSQLDPCITPVEEVSSKLQNLVLGEDSKLDEFIRKGEISKATLLALSVLKAANTDTSECKQPLSQGLKTLVRVRIAK
ncbi:hypothetical protein OS493_022309 [Desmophyllum pertusum]|uniref:REJ domain-containing protein n=1 Tax=Desmophyllum pertusum TaxID=174260 RepID=A0A9W9ZZJ8_9CNID|nr:hypothetical protein OS493_022309 [Desmophyllum pertusum]